MKTRCTIKKYYIKMTDLKIASKNTYSELKFNDAKKGTKGKLMLELSCLFFYWCEECIMNIISIYTTYSIYIRMYMCQFVLMCCSNFYHYNYIFISLVIPYYEYVHTAKHQTYFKVSFSNYYIYIYTYMKNLVGTVNNLFVNNEMISDLHIHTRRYCTMYMNENENYYLIKFDCMSSVSFHFPLLLLLSPTLH